jgi:pimeloyl-ACP methyl ester carboxylesterase
MKQAIVIIGGYNSLWPTYLQMARHLEDLTGLQAVGVPLMPWHWWLAGREEDATNILEKLEETMAWARRKFRADRFVLVGHSAGGLIARLYLCQQPVWGRVYGGLEQVTMLLTLGTPHCSSRGANSGWFLSDEANHLAPGTPHADRVHYRTVAGRYVQGHEEGSYRERRAFRTHRFFNGRGDVWGDGLVPVPCARLDGAETVILEGVSHSAKFGRRWYGGSKAIIRRWWPEGTEDAG